MISLLAQNDHDLATVDFSGPEALDLHENIPLRSVFM